MKLSEQSFIGSKTGNYDKFIINNFFNRKPLFWPL